MAVSKQAQESQVEKAPIGASSSLHSKKGRLSAEIAKLRTELSSGGGSISASSFSGAEVLLNTHSLFSKTSSATRQGPGRRFDGMLDDVPLGARFDIRQY